MGAAMERLGDLQVTRRPSRRSLGESRRWRRANPRPENPTTTNVGRSSREIDSRESGAAQRTPRSPMVVTLLGMVTLVRLGHQGTRSPRCW